MATRTPVQLSPPPNHSEKGIGAIMKLWLNHVYDRLGQGPFMVQGYAKAAMPAPANWARTTSPSFTSLIFVHDATGGAVVAYSNGTNWLRIDTNAVIT